MVKHLIKYAKASFMAYAAAGSIASDSISGIRTLVSFSAHEKQVRNYDETLLTSTKLAIKKRLAHAVGVACTMLTIFFSYGIGLYYGGILVVQDVSFKNFFFHFLKENYLEFSRRRYCYCVFCCFNEWYCYVPIGS